MLMLNQLTEEQRLTKAVVSIMGNPKYTALAGVLMIGERNVVDDPNVPTACTNGRDEMYGREFVKLLNDAELRFLVLHEVYHKLFKHLTTWTHLYKQDAQLANMSAWTAHRCTTCSSKTKTRMVTAKTAMVTVAMVVAHYLTDSSRSTSTIGRAHRN